MSGGQGQSGTGSKDLVITRQVSDIYYQPSNGSLRHIRELIYNTKSALSLTIKANLYRNEYVYMSPTRNKPYSSGSGAALDSGIPASHVKPMPRAVLCRMNVLCAYRELREVHTPHRKWWVWASIFGTQNLTHALLLKINAGSAVSCLSSFGSPVTVDMWV